MYNNLQWVDHVATPDRTFNIEENADGTKTITPAGEIVQQGTHMNAQNFNNIEMGLTDSDLSVRILLQLVRNLEDNYNDLKKEIEEIKASL